MIKVNKFIYEPGEHETEKASNAYVMSLIAVAAGLPVPIINLIASFGFYLGNKSSSYFVRWHCIQSLLSQLSLFLMNSFGFWWTMSILFGSQIVSNDYIAYLITILAFNLAEFIGTIYAAIQTRKGLHVQWWFYGNLTNLICKP